MCMYRANVNTLICYQKSFGNQNAAAWQPSLQIRIVQPLALAILLWMCAHWDRYGRVGGGFGTGAWGAKRVREVMAGGRGEEYCDLKVHAACTPRIRSCVVRAVLLSLKERTTRL